MTQELLGRVSITPTAQKAAAKVLSLNDFSRQIQEHVSDNTTELVDIILAGAIALEASDIHIEPQEKDCRLRVRIDGILRDVIDLDLQAYRTLLSRLKLLSKIKLNITDKPQDGRFSIEINLPAQAGRTAIEIRTSALPAEYGESLVMRLLNPKNLLKMEQLGLRKDLHEIFSKEIKKPNGMIIVTGPTGAGKTTTLYAFLMEIKNPAIKIITIEDPIEYHIKSISQTQAAPEKGYSFAEGLRSIVRQDPDVILVGEVRDLETAKISLQAALTGHLVLTTLHTNDAAGAIPRLVDLGADSASISSAVTMVVAQRLVRKVCPKCAVLAKPPPQIIAELKKGLAHVPKAVTGIANFEKIKVAKESDKGCAACAMTGYKGRMGLYEIFRVDAGMERFIAKNPPVSDIKEKAVKDGMITMYQSGLIEVALGKTTLEEVKRVVEQD